MDKIGINSFEEWVEEMGIKEIGIEALLAYKMFTEARFHRPGEERQCIAELLDDAFARKLTEE